MPIKIGSYRIQKTIAATHYNDVYEGLSRTGRKVVVKIAADEAHSAVPFVEHAILRLAGYPSIVEAVSCGKHKGLGYVVVELLEGSTLHDHLIQVGAINYIEVINQILSIAQGLLPVWKANLQHGDIQPSNVIVHNDRGWVLYDFHSTAQYQAGVCDAYGIPSIFAYAAPERFPGYDPDYVPSPQIDFYALGVIALESMVGSHVLTESQGYVSSIVDDFAHPLIIGFPRAFKNLLKRCCGSDLSLRIKDPLEFMERFALLKDIRWE